MLKPWIHKTRAPSKEKKQKMIKQQKKTTKEEEKSALPVFFLLFFGPMGLAETIAIFFSAFLECAQIFKKQTFMNRTLQLFLVISILSL